MLAYADVCWRMLAYADTMRQLSHKELLNLETDIIKKTRDHFFDYLYLLDEAPRTHKISLRRRGFARIPPEV
jgi:hypothetical protein